MEARPLHASLGRWPMNEREKEEEKKKKEIISDPKFLVNDVQECVMSCVSGCRTTFVS